MSRGQKKKVETPEVAKHMTRQELASKLWETANNLRDKIAASEYQDFILGFIFYKYLSEREERYCLNPETLNFKREELPDLLTEEQPAVVQVLQSQMGYFISYDHLFSTWVANGVDVATVRDALQAFDRLIQPTPKKLFNGIFQDLSQGLGKLGEQSNDQTKRIAAILQSVNQIPMNRQQDFDMLGFVYEYLIEKFASNAGTKAGEFYTPHEVSTLMSDIVADHLKDRKTIKIYDSTSGSGSLLINIGRSVARTTGLSGQISYYAQELKPETYNLTRMNLVMRGINPANITTRQGDTLADLDWPLFDERDPQNTYEPLFVDASVANPPYSQKWDPEGKEGDPRFKSFGFAPKRKADYAFLLHDLYHIKPDGILAIVLPHGVLFRGNAEGVIRQNLVDRGFIDTIIGLPANIFYGTGIPTIIMILKKQRPTTDILFVDASKCFEKAGKKNKLRARDVRKIADVVKQRANEPGFSRVVSLQEIQENEYNLNIPRYVDSGAKAESWDLYGSFFGTISDAELTAFDSLWSTFPTLKGDLFEQDATFGWRVRPDFAERFHANAELHAFRQTCVDTLMPFRAILKNALLSDLTAINLDTIELSLAEVLDQYMDTLPLLDRYAAYQALHDAMLPVLEDLDDIGMTADPIEGARAVIPSTLIAQTYFSEQLAEIDTLQIKLEEVDALEASLAAQAREYMLAEGLIEEKPEEDDEKKSKEEKAEAKAAAKEAPDAFIKPKGDGFTSPNALDKAKTDFSDEPELVKLLVQGLQAKKNHSAIVKQRNKLKKELDEAVKEKRAALTSEEVMTLLETKWISPLMDNLFALADTTLAEHRGALQALIAKYAETIPELAEKTRIAEQELSALLGDLQGAPASLKALDAFKTFLGGNL